MHRTTKQKLRQYILWVVWILIIQIVLANISAAIYAYKFTHFFTNPPPYKPTKNILAKTWKLFTGPRIYKLATDSTIPSEYEIIKLRTNNNLSIEGWYGSVDTPKGCIVFFHGITNNKSVLLEEANQFRSWGYNVLLIDFRAHGNSEGAKSSFGYKETDEVEKAFQYARLKGNKNIILYGSSLGSVVIMKAIAENKIAPAAIIADMPFGSLRHHLRARASEMGFPSEPFAFLVTLWIGIENGYNGFNHQAYNYAKKINCPVLLQCGDRDMYVSEKEIKRIYKNLEVAHKKLVIYPGANHQSFLQYDPIFWQKNITGFLDSLSS